MSVPRLEKIPTGVPGFDVITHGGLPLRRTTLLAGKSGAAKSILALQFATSLAKRGIKTLVVTVEEPAEDLLDTGEALGFSPVALVKEGLLEIRDLTRPMDGATVVTGDYDLGGLVHAIDAGVKQKGFQALVLDSATALFSPRPPEERLRSQFFQLIHACRKLGLTTLITAESPEDYGPRTTLGVEDYVCDAVVVLRNLVDNERRRRTIEVHKYRRSAHYKGEYPFTITNKGISVFPLDTASQQHVPEAGRFSSGIAGLDQMNHGGWLRDSIVLVRGPSGSGKTTLSAMYARAGAARGERVIYYGFEETRQILLRNLAKMGIPFEEFEKKGTLRLVCRYPEATSPEDLLVDIRTGLDEFRPSLVVLDSVSSIEHSNSERGFRQFMVGMAALIREHSRSALLTQTITRGDEDTAAPYLSTIPDAILRLDYQIRDHELERTIQVLKMRGSSHETAELGLTIGAGGLEISRLK